MKLHGSNMIKHKLHEIECSKMPKIFQSIMLKNDSRMQKVRVNSQEKRPEICYVKLAEGYFGKFTFKQKSKWI